MAKIAIPCLGHETTAILQSIGASPEWAAANPGTAKISGYGPPLRGGTPFPVWQGIS